MPHFLGNQQKQHSTEEANESRLVTKTRWVVESINDLIKRWCFFNQVVPNSNIPTLKDDFRIVCAIINCYRPPRVENKENDKKTANEMVQRSKKTNDFKAYVENNKRK